MKLVNHEINERVSVRLYERLFGGGSFPDRLLRVAMDMWSLLWVD